MGYRKLIFAALLFSASLVGAETSNEIPAVLYRDGSGRSEPDWVVADSVVTSSGDVDAHLFSVADRTIIQSYLAVPPQDGCVRLGLATVQDKVDSPNRRPDLASAIRNTEWVMLARVTARAGGFHRSEPGTLLQVEPVEIFKGPKKRSGRSFVFMPLGRLKVGVTEICKTHPLYADLPKVGEEVLLFVDPDWRNQGELLDTGNLGAGAETGIVTIHSDGKVSLPEVYRDAGKARSPSTRADLRDLIQRTIQIER